MEAQRCATAGRRNSSSYSCIRDVGCLCPQRDAADRNACCGRRVVMVEVVMGRFRWRGGWPVRLTLRGKVPGNRSAEPGEHLNTM